MIVTTSGRPNKSSIYKAKEIALQLNKPFMNRSKRSVEEMKQYYAQDVLVVGKNRLELHILHSNEPLFFHPNSAMFRIKRLLNHEEDPFCIACKLHEGDTFLDCTLGLASDSIVASFVVGQEGIVQGIEANEILAYVVHEGLKKWETGIKSFDSAMRRIEVNTGNHLDFLRSYPDNSFDVVYFDPMFAETISDSKGISPLRNIADYSPLSSETIEEAKRVAKRRIVLKDHWKSHRFIEHNFTVAVRKSAKFHYGVIEI